jgi:hypothetical protein
LARRDWSHPEGPHLAKGDAMSWMRMAASGAILIGGSTYAVIAIVRDVGWSLQLGAMAFLFVVVLLGSLFIELRSQAQEVRKPVEPSDNGEETVEVSSEPN